MKKPLMKKRMLNKVLALLLAFLTFLGTAYDPVMAAGTEITISSIEEFAAFSQKCSLDTWSQGKTVRLTADLDLNGTDFSAIPTFGGTFLGGGHTITGLYLTGNGSNQGLFRYIQPGGAVSDLKVKGTVQPGGSCTNVGGIAGNNSGLIQNCEFQGSVKGDAAAGGIAGVNQETGQINGCFVSGSVQGQNGTGGIAGKNQGILMKCRNAASVNTTENAAVSDADAVEALQQLTGGDTAESLLDGHTDTGGVVGYSGGVVQSCTNTGTVGYSHVGYNVGGVAGRQTGYLSGCVNSGNVLGRKDVGGIAGQAEPYIAILPAGDSLDRLRTELDTLDSLIAQALDDADATGDDLSVRLTSLGQITDNARNSSKQLADSSVEFIDQNIAALNSLSVTLVNGLDNLAPAVDELENTAHWLDLMIESLEAGMKNLELSPEEEETLDASVEKMRSACEGLLYTPENLKAALEKLMDALLRKDETDIAKAMGEVRTALAELGRAYREAGDALGNMDKPLKPILPDGGKETEEETEETEETSEETTEEETEETTEEASEEMTEEETEETEETPEETTEEETEETTEEASEEASEETTEEASEETTEEASEETTEEASEETSGENKEEPTADAAEERVEDVGETDDISGDLEPTQFVGVEFALEYVVSVNETEESSEPGEETPDELQNIFCQIAEALEQLANSLPDSPEDWEEVQGALDEVSGALKKSLSDVKDMGSAAEKIFTTLRDGIDVRSARDNFSAAAEHAGSMSRSLERSFGTMADVMRKISADGPIEFASLGEDTRAAGESLYASLGDLTAQMQELNTSMQGNGEVLTADIRAISHQFNAVFDVLLDSMYEIRDGEKKDEEDYIQDTSDEDIAATRLGKVVDCRSTGTVEGDRNVGGILGSMAVEYDLDPEDDVKHFSFSNTYELKVVLENCVNNGNVIGKKDCVGGLVGRMDLGTAIDGQNYGTVESTNGDYVGGAVGWGDGSIRRCYAKCNLSGGDYVGGLAGWTDKLTDSCAIASVLRGTEFVGAIAGDADLEKGVIRNNRFVDTGIAAIDGISYTGKAVPEAFEDLRKQEGIPVEFVSFSLTLLADGKTVAKIPFLYGNDLSLVELPEVPAREGEYGKWPEFDTSGLKSDITLEAVYAPWVTVVESEEKDGKLSLALAEGSFTEETKLHVTDGESTPPAKDICAVWNVELSGTGLTDSDEVPLRLLNKAGRRAEVWQLADGVWKQVDADLRGQYLMVIMTGTTGTFGICESADKGLSVLWTVVVLAAFVSAVLGYFRLRRKKTTKKECKDQTNAI